MKHYEDLTTIEKLALSLPDLAYCIDLADYHTDHLEAWFDKHPADDNQDERDGIEAKRHSIASAREFLAVMDTYIKNSYPKVYRQLLDGELVASPEEAK
jgi:hypothetical protein